MCIRDRYYLVQLASGGANGVALPTADTTGGINMSGSAGKIALMSTTTVITSGTSCPSTNVVDLVGFGPATNCSETAPTTPNLTVTTAAIRAGNGCTETDNNSTDFANGTPNPVSYTHLDVYKRQGSGFTVPWRAWVQ